MRNSHKDAFWFQRLWDYKAYIAINPNLFCFKQPSDFMACSYGQFYLLECKSSTLKRFNVDNLKPHQEEAMHLIEEAGGVYWLLIMHRDTTEKHAHKIYALRPVKWRLVKQETKEAGYVSASWDVIAKNADFELTKSGGILNVDPLFNKVWLGDGHVTRGVKRALRFRHWNNYQHGNILKRVTNTTLKEYWAREGGAAIFDADTGEVSVIVDEWVFKQWETFFMMMCNRFIERMMIDYSVTIFHELEHWATEPTNFDSLRLRQWENSVEKVSCDCVNLRERSNHCQIIHLSDRICGDCKKYEKDRGLCEFCDKVGVKGWRNQINPENGEECWIMDC